MHCLTSSETCMLVGSCSSQPNLVILSMAMSLGPQSVCLNHASHTLTWPSTHLSAMTLLLTLFCELFYSPCHSCCISALKFFLLWYLRSVHALYSLCTDSMHVPLHIGYHVVLPPYSTTLPPCSASTPYTAGLGLILISSNWDNLKTYPDFMTQNPH